MRRRSGHQKITAMRALDLLSELQMGFNQETRQTNYRAVEQVCNALKEHVRAMLAAKRKR